MTAPFIPCTPAEAEMADRIRNPYTWFKIDSYLVGSSIRFQMIAQQDKDKLITAMQRAVDKVLAGRAAG